MQSITVGASTLFYETFGSGFPVVFVHGVGGNHASWYAQVRCLSESYRTVTYDQRGFGRSNDIEGLGRDAMTDDLLRLLDELGLEKVALVGQSMGGGPCVGLTCRYPDRVSSLVLADTVIGIKLPPELDGPMAEVRRATANLTQAERVIGATTRERDRDRTFLYLQIASFNTVNVKTLSGTLPTHPIEQLRSTDVPILFIVGEEDILAPPAIVRAVHERLNGSEFLQLPGVGHSANFEAPDQFNAGVLSFLERRLAVGATGARS